MYQKNFRKQVDILYAIIFFDIIHYDENHELVKHQIRNDGKANKDEPLTERNLFLKNLGYKYVENNNLPDPKQISDINLDLSKELVIQILKKIS